MNTIINRIIDFYRRHAGSQDIGLIWQTISGTHEAALVNALREGNESDVEREISTFVSGGKSFGIEHAMPTWDTPVMDGLLKPLFQSIGILPLENPEQPSPTQNHTPQSLTALVPEAERILGLKFSVPPCFGFDASDSAGVPHRYIFYLAAADYHLQQSGRAPSDVLEIGAGLGNLGYIASQWKSNSYTVIDLPHVACLSAYFMAKVVGEERVWLLGEPENHAAFANFYPCSNHSGVRQKKYDLVFNSDSLPEMPIHFQDAYIKLVFDVLTDNGLFISINHESDAGGQSSVRKAINRTPGLCSVARFPFLMRNGYIVEIFRKPQK